MRPSLTRLDNRWSNRWVPWAFIGGFAVVIVANAALIWLAVASFSGLAEADAYRRGLDYNKTLAVARAQDRLGWESAIELVPTTSDGSRAFTITVRLADAQGRSLDGGKVRALLIRPTAAGHDRAAVLDGSGEGRYRGRIDLLLPGQWEARILVERGTDRWQAAYRLTVP